MSGDRRGEPNETFVVNLSSPTNATIADGQGIGTILDDEPRISINDVTVTEGNTGTVNATFTVSLSVAYDVAVTVHYQTANGSATAGSDYAAASGDVIIAAGQTTKTFTVAVIGDRLPEPTETFVVNLSAATNGLIVDSQGVGTVLDNEPHISISDVTKAEGRSDSPRGLAFWTKFAKAHKKPLAIPEWGLNRRSDGHGGGDNPYFIERMHAFITDPANNVLFHCYFDVNVADENHRHVIGHTPASSRGAGRRAK